MPDANVTRRQLMLAAIESAYGSDAAPQETNSFQAIKMIDPFTLNLGTEMVEVQGGNLTRGMSRPIATVRTIEVTFRTYVQGLDSGSYTANRKPPIADLLRACGMFETFVSSDANGRPVYRYDPGADVGSDSSVTFVAHQDGYEHRALGARGNCNLIWSAAEPVVAEFTLQGILTTEASTTRGSPTGLPARVPPRWIGSGSVFIESLSANMENLNLNTNNEILPQRASQANSGSGIVNVWLTSRLPGGSFDPQVTETDTFDFFAAWRATSGAVLRAQAGLDQGNRFVMIASQSVIKTMAWADNTGLALFNVEYQCYESAGQDEWRLEFS